MKTTAVQEVGGGALRARAARTGDIGLPPTLFARQSPTELVEAGHDLALRAIGMALEGVPVDDAVPALIELADHRGSVLRMAHDYLGYTTFDEPLPARADAFTLVEHALYQLDREQAPQPLLARLLDRIRRRARRGR